LQKKIVFKLGDFFSLQNKPSLVERRRKGNQRALKQLQIAKKAAKVLSWFPFVKSVAVSGSLSKMFADEKSDIDFFIITSGNRLWISRTFMHLFKKITYLAGKQNWFCMNYYVDDIWMEIPEKNIFTAMEIVTLIPMQGLKYFRQFIEANDWTNLFFASHTISSNVGMEIKKGFAGTCIEKILTSGIADHLDEWLMRTTDKRWKKKTVTGKVNDHGLEVGMMVNRHFSKPDPKNFQAKIIQQYERKINQLLQSNQQMK